MAYIDTKFPDFRAKRYDKDLRHNWRDIQNKVVLSDTKANRPTSEVPDKAWYYAEDEQIFYQYLPDHADADADGWVIRGGVGSTNTGERGLQPEGAQTGLAADTTGIKYEGAVTQTIDEKLITSGSDIRLEAVTQSSAGDEDVTVEVYDDTAAVVADSVTITGGGQTSKDITTSLTAGNTVHVRWNVTTASATSGATFDAFTSRLVIV